MKMKMIVMALLVLMTVGCENESSSSSGGATVPAGPTLKRDLTDCMTSPPYIQLSWSSVSGATSYNIYWSTAPGVTKTTGTKIASAASPYIHWITSKVHYYYVVTAVNSAGESALSNEINSGCN